EAFIEDRSFVRLPIEVELSELLTALREVMGRAELFSRHQISQEPLSVRERMSRIMSSLHENPYLEFHQVFDLGEGRMGVVVSFLALLELIREQLVDLVQTKSFGQIYIKSPK
ncbi:MAG: segregation/condensation protein A, partial [Gammaproteobacteria bacterium]|nr:segregation/condensation protein A [Gammaproteobacteria bacterium]